MARNILPNEKENDSFNTLIHLMKAHGVITNREKDILEKIRDCRNDNAHGKEYSIDVPKLIAKRHILKTFEVMKKI